MRQNRGTTPPSQGTNPATATRWVSSHRRVRVSFNARSWSRCTIFITNLIPNPNTGNQERFVSKYACHHACPRVVFLPTPLHKWTSTNFCLIAAASASARAIHPLPTISVYQVRLQNIFFAPRRTERRRIKIHAARRATNR
jgi:hypothetical protein